MSSSFWRRKINDFLSFYFILFIYFFFFLHRYHLYTIIAVLLILPSKTLLQFFSSKFLFLNLQLSIFYRYFISNNYCLQMLYYIEVIITVFQRSLDLCFFIMSESLCFSQKTCCVYIN